MKIIPLFLLSALSYAQGRPLPPSAQTLQAQRVARQLANQKLKTDFCEPIVKQLCFTQSSRFNNFLSMLKDQGLAVDDLTKLDQNYQDIAAGLTEDLQNCAEQAIKPCNGTQLRPTPADKTVYEIKRPVLYSTSYSNQFAMYLMKHPLVVKTDLIIKKETMTIREEDPRTRSPITSKREVDVSVQLYKIPFPPYLVCQESIPTLINPIHVVYKCVVVEDEEEAREMTEIPSRFK